MSDPPEGREESHEGEIVFRERDLRRFDGSRGSRILIAYRGVVYDVTDCMKWRTGLHEGLHFPGQDLTGEIGEAPHAEEVFKHPCVKRVGVVEGSAADRRE